MMETALVSFTSIPFFYAALVGSYVLFLEQQKYPEIKQSLWLALFILPILIFEFVKHRFSLSLILRSSTWAIFLGAFCVLVVNFIHNHSKRKFELLMLFLLMPFLAIITQYFLLFFHHVSLTQDPLLYAFDATLGFNPSFILSQIYARSPFLIQIFFVIVYVALPIAIALAYIGIHSEDNRTRQKFLLEIVLIGAIGFSLYNIIPGCGTSYFFGSAYPFHPPIPLLNPYIYAKPAFHGLVPCNCMPSLHTAWILCIWRYVWQNRPNWRLVISIWAGLGLIATIVVGLHYLIDIVVGFAFALTLQSFFVDIPWSQPIRWRSFLCGITLFVSWLLIIKHSIDIMRISLLIPQFLYSFSFILCSVLIYRLSNTKIVEKSISKQVIGETT